MSVTSIELECNAVNVLVRRVQEAASQAEEAIKNANLPLAMAALQVAKIAASSITLRSGALPNFAAEGGACFVSAARVVTIELFKVQKMVNHARSLNRNLPTPVLVIRVDQKASE